MTLASLSNATVERPPRDQPRHDCGLDEGRYEYKGKGNHKGKGKGKGAMKGVPVEKGPAAKTAFGAITPSAAASCATNTTM